MLGSFLVSVAEHRVRRTLDFWAWQSSKYQVPPCLFIVNWKKMKKETATKCPRD